MMLEVAANVASCAEDVHAVGEGFDKLIERTQAEVLDAKPSLQRRRRQQQTPRREQPLWWDSELAAGRRTALRAARQDPKSHAAATLGKAYRTLLRRKQRQFSRAEAIAITTLASDLSLIHISEPTRRS